MQRDNTLIVCVVLLISAIVISVIWSGSSVGTIRRQNTILNGVSINISGATNANMQVFQITHVSPLTLHLEFRR
jgi:hypothetical protein